MPPLPSWINVFRYVLPVVLYKSHSEASDCTPLQIDGCKNSARDGTLSTLTGGGECQARTYVQYTHLCTVSDYEPTTDFCCCAQDQKVMCCRYHNSWDVFRCIEADDTIDTLPANPLTQEVLFTIILVPTAAVICCVICCVRYVCCCDENEGAMCGCNKYGGHQYGEQYVTSCKKSGDDSGHSGSRTSSNGSARSAHELSSNSNQITPPIPSAPPEEDLINSAPPTPPKIAEVLLPKVTLQDKILPGHEAAGQPQSALLIVHSDSDIVQNIPVTLVQNMYPEHRYVRSISNDYPRNFNNITYQPLQRSLSVANSSVPNGVVPNSNPKIPNVCSTFVLPEGPPPMYKDI